MKYETIIGLEVHAQLLTKSKMFCGCSTDYASTPPNTHVCPVCMGMPGVLPVINRQAVEYTMMTALALNCSITENTRFDRKNYIYPDLMKGYQISQSYAPIGYNGSLTININSQEKKIGIDNIHLEEDTARLLHRSAAGGDYSLVDINRAGTPLMEIVCDPDLRSPEEARQYLMQLRSILQYLGVSTGNMEEGSFRCDANISIRPQGSTELGVKVEVKNMNSFKSVFLAMEYEVQRQTKAANQGKKLVQETRGWVEDRGKTVPQRTKEYAHDYRYFPEPDLPPVIISREWIEEVRAKLPELPEQKRRRFMSEYGLPVASTVQITNDKLLADYEEKYIKASETSGLSLDERAKTGSNWILGEISRIFNINNISISEFEEKVSPENLFNLTDLIMKGKITGTMAKPILEEMFNTGKSADEIISERGLTQISDTRELEKIVSEVINSNAQPVADFRAGKETALKFLVGQVMRATRGQANPQLVNEVLKKKLAE
jgi:aspartyl-tRNA(Asn)/glutamyl-tRNA(Gln) amidotransferase subunit B